MHLWWPSGLLSLLKVGSNDTRLKAYIAKFIPCSEVDISQLLWTIFSSVQTVLLLKNTSLIPNKNFPCSLCLFSLIQTPCAFKKKSNSIFFIASHQVAEDNKQMSLQTSPNENTQFPQHTVHHVLQLYLSLAVLHWSFSSMPMLEWSY